MSHSPELHQSPNDHEQPHEQLNLNLPIILAGYTGSGKDTVSHSAIKVADSTAGSRHTFHHSRSRYTDRARRPSEIQGIHGYFVSPNEFDARKDKGEFLYDYKKEAYGGIRYGFSWPILRDEIESKHTFVVGGEIDTSLELKAALDNIAVNSRRITEAVQHVLHPVILFVNRPMDKIIEGIKMRGAGEEEKKKRIAHVEAHWERYPKALAGGERVELIWNEDIETATRQVLHFVEAEVSRQIQDLLGSKGTKRRQQ